MRRASFWFVFFIGTIIGVIASQITYSSLKALPPKGGKVVSVNPGCGCGLDCDCGESCRCLMDKPEKK